MNMEARVWRAVESAPVLDLHTHLFPPTFGSLCLWGIDELLTYHYLIAETLRARPDLAPEALLAASKAEQADLVWQTLFVDRLPLSEATAGVVTSLSLLGLDPNERNLSNHRKALQGRTAEEQIDLVFRSANVAGVTMTNDPLDPAERTFWESGVEVDPRFHTALRIDPLLNDFLRAIPLIRQGTDDDFTETARFLDRWVAIMRPRYMAVSLPPDFDFPTQDLRTQVLRNSVLPACERHGLPLAMMIGVKRQVNPRLGSAGDGGATADLSSVERLAAEFPGVRFLVTTLMRENVHALCVIARKFAHVLPFGCWWFMNNPSLIEDVTDQRLEMLGTTFVPQHSDARILEQLLYKWAHSRRVIAGSLTKRFVALEDAGRSITDAEIQTEVERLFQDNAAAWMGVAR